MPSDGLPYSPRRISKDRLDKLEKQHELLDRIFSRPRPTADDEGERAEKWAAGKTIGQHRGALHKITPLMGQVERYISFAPEAIQNQLQRETLYNLTKFPTNQVFEDLATRIKDERQSAVSQGYEVPDPMDFSYPAPPGLLTQMELTRVKRARTNA